MSDLVTIRSWRAGKDGRVDRLSRRRAADRLAALRDEGRCASAEDDAGQTIGEVVRNDDTGRLVWWYEQP